MRLVDLYTIYFSIIAVGANYFKPFRRINSVKVPLKMKDRKKSCDLFLKIQPNSCRMIVKRAFLFFYLMLFVTTFDNCVM